MKNYKQIEPTPPVISLIRNIKLSEILDKELNPLSKKIKEFIDDKLDGLIQFESDNYPDSIFYKKNDIILFEVDLKNKWLWCSYEHYWLLLDKEIGINYFETQELTKAMVGTHLNCKDFIPIDDYLHDMTRV